MPDEMRELGFPIQGQDVSGEFMTQPGLTTPRAANVRAADPLTMRLRGGSRTGLAKFVGEQVSGAALIQHLNVVVDPTVDALIPDYIDGTSNLTPDPTEPARNPFGRSVRTGGSGTPILRHKPLPLSRFVQKAETFVGVVTGTTTSTGTVTFDSKVTAGNLIVVTLRYAPGNSNAPTFDPAAVTDTTLNHYAKAADAQEGRVAPNAAVVYWTIAGISDTCTISVTVTTDGAATQDVGEFTITALEYRNVEGGNPVGGTAVAGGNFVWNNDFTLSPGPVVVATDDSIVVVVLSQGVGPGTADIGPQPDIPTDPQLHTRAFATGGSGMAAASVFDAYGVGATAIGWTPTYTAHPTGTPSGATVYWAMAAVSFKPKS